MFIYLASFNFFCVLYIYTALIFFDFFSYYQDVIKCTAEIF